MRSIIPIILIICLCTCSIHDIASSDASRQRKPSTRRADHGKYILKQRSGVGSRPLFIQPGGKKCLNSSKAVANYFKENLKHTKGEQTFVLFLDKQNQLIEMTFIENEITSDSKNFTQIVVQKAEIYQAVSAILVRSQHSPYSVPYQQDRSIAKALQQTLGQIGVSLLDHIIMSQNDCYSFADNRLL